MTEHGSVCATESFFPRLKRREALLAAWGLCVYST